MRNKILKFTISSIIISTITFTTSNSFFLTKNELANDDFNINSNEVVIEQNPEALSINKFYRIKQKFSHPDYSKWSEFRLNRIKDSKDGHYVRPLEYDAPGNEIYFKNRPGVIKLDHTVGELNPFFTFAYEEELRTYIDPMHQKSYLGENPETYFGNEFDGTDNDFSDFIYTQYLEFQKQTSNDLELFISDARKNTPANIYHEFDLLNRMMRGLITEEEYLNMNNKFIFEEFPTKDEVIFSDMTMTFMENIKESCYVEVSEEYAESKNYRKELLLTDYHSFEETKEEISRASLIMVELYSWIDNTFIDVPKALITENFEEYENDLNEGGKTNFYMNLSFIQSNYDYYNIEYKPFGSQPPDPPKVEKITIAQNGAKIDINGFDFETNTKEHELSIPVSSLSVDNYSSIPQLKLDISDDSDFITFKEELQNKINDYEFESKEINLRTIEDFLINPLVDVMHKYTWVDYPRSNDLYLDEESVWIWIKKIDVKDNIIYANTDLGFDLKDSDGNVKISGENNMIIEIPLDKSLLPPTDSTVGTNSSNNTVMIIAMSISALAAIGSVAYVYSNQNKAKTTYETTTTFKTSSITQPKKQKISKIKIEKPKKQKNSSKATKTKNPKTSKKWEQFATKEFNSNSILGKQNSSKESTKEFGKWDNISLD